MKKQIINATIGFAILTVVTLAAFQVISICRALFTPDRNVAYRCNAAISRDLKCWCYHRHMRMCPRE